ncbi:MAG: hypothetical protein II998_12475 [Clostridia bacterium]|nr:hypothetical protein [Clostridia bacterium]
MDEIYVLLFLGLLIGREKNPFAFSHKAENSEIFVDFPKAKLELGKLATLLFRCFVGKASAKGKRNGEDSISFLAISDLLIRAHNLFCADRFRRKMKGGTKGAAVEDKAYTL